MLLDTAFQPRTVWQFDALLVLLNGHWPPRGLLSGHWPPEPAALAAAGSSPRPPVHPSSRFGGREDGSTGSGESFTGSGEGTVLPPEHLESGFRHTCGHSCHNGLPAAHRSVSMPVLADGVREAAAGASTRCRGASPPHTRRSEGCASDGCQGASHERRRKQTCVRCVCLLVDPMLVTCVPPDVVAAIC